MGSKKKFSVWKSFAALIRKIRLPLALLVAAFLLNLGKAVIELVIPDKMAALSEIDLGVGVFKPAGGDVPHRRERIDHQVDDLIVQSARFQKTRGVCLDDDTRSADMVFQ